MGRATENSKDSVITCAANEGSGQHAPPCRLIRTVTLHTRLLWVLGFPRREHWWFIPYWTDVQADQIPFGRRTKPSQYVSYLDLFARTTKRLLSAYAVWLELWIVLFLEVFDRKRSFVVVVSRNVRDRSSKFWEVCAFVQSDLILQCF